MSQNRILVTGATGLNGRALLKELADNGISAKALVRDVSKATFIKEMGHELIKGDFSDSGSLEHAFTSVDRVYLLSSIQQNTVALLQNVIDTAGKSGVGHIEHRRCA